ncbi:unnamed protein product [Phytomonas sp. Hart1]|nr:unnamed protein product [Phytomonas sp. Hart1]|eukprot:CCW66837.1 unnamed protein product [Phytomonas sp. isolate Hart1]
MNFDLFEDDLKNIHPTTVGTDQRRRPTSVVDPSRNATTRTSLSPSAETVPSFLGAIPPRPTAGRRATVASTSKSPLFPFVSDGFDNHQTPSPVPLETTSSSMVGAAPEVPRRAGRRATIKAETASIDVFEERFDTGKGTLDFLDWSSPPEAHKTPNAINTVKHTEVDEIAVQHAAEVEKHRTEMRGLYASLDAINAEIKELDDKLDTRQAKGEAEIIELGTTRLMKSMELEEQEKQLGEACEAVRKETTTRLEAMSDHHTEEMNNLKQRMRDKDTERFKNQLLHLQESLLRVSNSVADLRCKRALLIQTDPYSPKGINLALSVAKEGGAVGEHESNMSRQHNDVASTSSDATSNPLRPVLHPSMLSSAPGATTQLQGQANCSLKATEATSKDGNESFESLINVGLCILQGYYDARLDAVKQHVVDYIHSETFEVTHAARIRREKGWFENMTDQKLHYGSYITNMMDRHFQWYSQRAAKRQESLEVLRERVRNAFTQLKEESKQRLLCLTAEVSAKVRRTLDQFEQSASEGCQALERRSMLTREGDSVIRQAQEEEVKGRCETEASVRRQLQRAELSGLQENISRMRSRIDCQTQERFKKLRLDATTASNRCGIESIEAQLKELRGLIQEQVLSVKSQRKVTGLNTTQHHSLIVETEQMVRTLMCTAQQQREQLNVHQQRCQELRQRIHQNLVETVERLQESRQVQRIQQSKVDFARRMWERDHQENLSAAIHLELPILASPFTETDKEPAVEAIVGVETLVSSGDITLAYLLQLVADRLRERDAQHRRLHTTQKQEWAAHSRELTVMRSLYDDVCQFWLSIANTFNELQRAESSLASQQVEVNTEAARAKIEGEKLEKERKSLVVRHRKLEEQMMTAKKGLNAALIALERQKQHHQQLSDLQLSHLHEQYHLATQQQQVSLHKTSARTTIATTYGGKTKHSPEQGIGNRSSVIMASLNSSMVLSEGEKSTSVPHRGATHQRQHQQVVHSFSTSVLPAWSTHYALLSSSQTSDVDSTRLGESAILCADRRVTTGVTSSLAVLSPTLQDHTHLPESAVPPSASQEKVVLY